MPAITLPPEVWDHVLRFGGPLSIATSPRSVAALRVQDAWRARPLVRVWTPGLAVRFRPRRADVAWREGRLARDVASDWVVEHARGRVWVQRTHLVVPVALPRPQSG